MKDFRRLKVWERAHKLVLFVYRLTAGFPSEEKYGLTSQLRRASASVAANIAEGCGRSGDGDFQRFLDVAMGSAVEVEYFLLLARDLGFLADDSYEDANRDVQEIQRILGSLIRKVASERTRR
jgi:four helix bundle protein